MSEIPDDLKPGDPVHVEFDGAYHGRLYGDRRLEIKDPRTGWVHQIRNDAEGFKITRRDPENWPPRVGDVWEAEGTLWFAVSGGNGAEDRLVPAANRFGISFRDLKSLSPVLKYRPEA